MTKGGLRTDYPVKEIAENTYLISDFGIANCYLAIGDKAALLIDCGLGIGDLKGAVEKITDKPLTVVCTHGHVDHAGGQGQFAKIYLHRKDAGGVYKFMTSFFLRRLFLAGSGDAVDKSIKACDLVRYGKNAEIEFVDDGYVFDLGGRKITAVHSVGHTYGSIILLDDKTKLMFVGDNICPSPWLFLPNASCVDEWLASAKEIYRLSEEYTPWWGHEGGLLTRGLIADVVKIGEEILDKYKKNSALFCIKFYPCNDRVNGSLVFRTTRVHNAK